MKSKLTLNEDYDYVRAIAYSAHGQVLFSTADNGIVRKWDLNVGKSESKSAQVSKHVVMIKTIIETSVTLDVTLTGKVIRFPRHHPNIAVVQSGWECGGCGFHR